DIAVPVQAERGGTQPGAEFERHSSGLRSTGKVNRAEHAVAQQEAVLEPGLVEVEAHDVPGVVDRARARADGTGEIQSNEGPSPGQQITVQGAATVVIVPHHVAIVVYSDGRCDRSKAREVNGREAPR